MWDAYSGLESTVKDMAASLRVVMELQSPALRDRHWHQLMKATGVGFLALVNGIFFLTVKCHSLDYIVYLE